MDIQRCRELRARMLAGDHWKKMDSGLRFAFAAGARASGHAEIAKAPLAFGLSAKAKGQYRLAVRVQHDVAGMAGVDAMLENIAQMADGEVDIRLTGEIKKSAPWHQSKNRPLRIGGSIHHFRHIAAGTLGCFVTKTTGSQDEDLILSNNHVLANENDARRRDRIVQPGRLDGGRTRRDVVGRLENFIPLKKKKNLVDAAICSIDDDIEYYYNWLERHGPLRGLRNSPIDIGDTVYKVGRTTGVTKGRVSAIELYDVRVGGYNDGVLSFDNQIEVERVGARPFSLAGDSGSLIFDANRRAVALLFAGNDVDLTYGNPIEQVLDVLKIKLVF